MADHSDPVTVRPGPDHAALLAAEVAAFVATARSGPLDAPVPTCPAWDLARLCTHQARALHMAAASLEGGGAVLDRDSLPQPDLGDPVGFLAAAGDRLCAVVAATDPDAPAWNFTTRPPVASFWSRRMALETAVHRVDAELTVAAAAGSGADPTPVDPLLAVDGIDEIFEVFLPRGLNPGHDSGGTIHLHAGDAPGEWTFSVRNGVLEVTRGHVKGDVAVQGTASDLYLMLWRRLPVDSPGIRVLGDTAVLEQFMSLGLPG
jgi:hypothetical protein